MTRAVAGLDRLGDLDELVAQEDRRGNRAPWPAGVTGA